MQDINSVTLVCRLVKDPEARTTTSGSTVCTMRVAYTQSRKNGQTSQWEETPGFIDVSVFGKQAETVVRYLSKGRQVIVKGRLDFREWGEEGNRQSRTSIVAEQVQFIGTGEGHANAAQQPITHQGNPANAPADNLDDCPF